MPFKSNLWLFNALFLVQIKTSQYAMELCAKPAIKRKTVTVPEGRKAQYIQGNNDKE